LFGLFLFCDFLLFSFGHAMPVAVVAHARKSGNKVTLERRARACVFSPFYP
jgi:hypothetical protein